MTQEIATLESVTARVNDLFSHIVVDAQLRSSLAGIIDLLNLQTSLLVAMAEKLTGERPTYHPDKNDTSRTYRPFSSPFPIRWEVSPLETGR